MKLPSLCYNKFFLMGLSASFMFTSMLIFNVVFPILDTQGQQIDVIHEDIKKILEDTAFIRGQLQK